VLEKTAFIKQNPLPSSPVEGTPLAAMSQTAPPNLADPTSVEGTPSTAVLSQPQKPSTIVGKTMTPKIAALSNMPWWQVLNKSAGLPGAAPASPTETAAVPAAGPAPQPAVPNAGMPNTAPQPTPVQAAPTEKDLFDVKAGGLKTKDQISLLKAKGEFEAQKAQAAAHTADAQSRAKQAEIAAASQQAAIDAYNMQLKQQQQAAAQQAKQQQAAAQQQQAPFTPAPGTMPTPMSPAPMGMA
jgi:hypothetical protein